MHQFHPQVLTAEQDLRDRAAPGAARPSGTLRAGPTSPGQVMTGRPSGKECPPVATLSDPAKT